MKLPHRRQFLHLAVGAAALPAASRGARAQTYPTMPLRLIVGFAAVGEGGFGERRKPRGEIGGKLNKAINAAPANPKFNAQLADVGGTALAGTPADFGKLIADETEKWAKVVRAAARMRRGDGFGSRVEAT